MLVSSIESARLSRASGPRCVTSPAPSRAWMSSITRSFAVAVVQRTGTRGQRLEDPDEPPVIGPEVVAPV